MRVILATILYSILRRKLSEETVDLLWSKVTKSQSLLQNQKNRVECNLF